MNKVKKITIVHHSADFDGLFSGAVAFIRFAYHNEFDINLIGWDFGDPLVHIPDDVDEVHVIDLPPDCLENPNTDKLVWIDHHKSAIEKFSPDIKGLRIDGVAACRLARYYYNRLEYDGMPTYEDFKKRRVSEPFILTLVGEHDVWDHSDPYTMPLQFALHALPDELTPEFLCDFLVKTEDYVYKMAESGKKIEQWQTNYAREVCKERSYLVEFEGIKFCALASVHARMSTWFPDDAIMDGAEGLMCIRMQGDGLVRISLYHRTNFNHHDLSKIAIKYGGGGHKGACGFEITTKQAIELGIIR